MKDRTLAVASGFARYVGALLGVAVLIVAVCEATAVVLCFQSELED